MRGISKIIAILILIIISITLYIFLTSPIFFIKSEVKNLINSNKLSAEKSIFVDNNTFSFVESLRGDKVNITKLSDNQGSGEIYYYCFMLNGKPMGVYIKNISNSFVPKWNIYKLQIQ